MGGVGSKMGGQEEGIGGWGEWGLRWGGQEGGIGGCVVGGSGV